MRITTQILQFILLCVAIVFTMQTTLYAIDNTSEEERSLWDKLFNKSKKQPPKDQKTPGVYYEPGKKNAHDSLTIVGGVDGENLDVTDILSSYRNISQQVHTERIRVDRFEPLDGRARKEMDQIAAIAEKPRPEDLSFIRELLSRPVEPLAPLAAAIAGQIPGTDKLLWDAMKHPRFDVRVNAMVGLVTKRSSRAAEACRLGLTDKSPWVRMTAAACAWDMKLSDGPKRILAQIAKENDPRVILHMMWALAEWGHEEGINGLESLLIAPMQNVTIVAAKLLGYYAKSRSIPALLSALFYPDLKLREECLYSLERMPLAIVAKTAEQAGVATLRRWHDMRCLAGLMPFDPKIVYYSLIGNQEERYLSILCIARWGGPKFGWVMLSARHDEWEDVRNLASDVLTYWHLNYRLDVPPPINVEPEVEYVWWFRQHSVMRVGNHSAEITFPGGDADILRVGERLGWDAVLVRADNEEVAVQLYNQIYRLRIAKR